MAQIVGQGGRNRFPCLPGLVLTLGLVVVGCGTPGTPPVQTVRCDYGVDPELTTQPVATDPAQCLSKAKAQLNMRPFTVADVSRYQKGDLGHTIEPVAVVREDYTEQRALDALMAYAEKAQHLTLCDEWRPRRSAA